MTTRKTRAVDDSAPQANLDTLVEEVLQTQRPALVVRDGHTVAALIPMPDYERFVTWQQRQTSARLLEQRRQLQREREAFETMKPELLQKYAGQFVAILDSQLWDADSDKRALAKRVYARFGYRTLLMTEVRKRRRVYHFDSPERVRR